MISRAVRNTKGSSARKGSLHFHRIRNDIRRMTTLDLANGNNQRVTGIRPSWKSLIEERHELRAVAMGSMVL